MTDSMKEIGSILYGGESLFNNKKSSYSADILYCLMPEECPVYKNNQCLMASRLKRKKCIYGSVTKLNGTSPRSASYHKLAVETRARESYKKITESTGYFYSIGDYFFIDLVFPELWQNIETEKYILRSPYSPPYSDRDSDEIKKKYKRLGKEVFILKTDLTLELMNQILSFEPRALFGGIIHSYKKEYIPQIKVGILQQAPELAKKCGIEEINYIGMMGLLKTLKAPIDFVFKNTAYHYNGKTVVSKDVNNVKSFLKTIGEALIVNVEFKLSDTFYIEIKDNAWIMPDSVIKRKI